MDIAFQAYASAKKVQVEPLQQGDGTQQPLVWQEAIPVAITCWNCATIGWGRAKALQTWLAPCFQK